MDAAISACDSTSLSALAFARRATGGVTAFRVQDPDPCAVNGGRVLGVRFDVFSVKKRAFVPPFFVFLVRVREEEENGDGVGGGVAEDLQGVDGQSRVDDEEGMQLLRVHKHTIPPVVPVVALAQRYLPVLSADDEEDVDEPNGLDAPKNLPTKQDLGKFVRAIRKELVGMVRRKDALEALEVDCTSRSHGSRLATRFAVMDGLGREVEMELRQGEVVKLLINMGGEKVEKVIVRTRGSDKGLGQRRRDVERAVMRNGGTLNGIIDRIRDALSPKITL